MMVFNISPSIFSPKNKNKNSFHYFEDYLMMEK
jgi:hypothetical protein